jgi:hypothetical protein
LGERLGEREKGGKERDLLVSGSAEAVTGDAVRFFDGAMSRVRREVAVNVSLIGARKVHVVDPSSAISTM